MPSVWTFQDPKQVAKRGEAKASWYVGWYSPSGHRKVKSCGAGTFGRRKASELKKKESELTLGIDSAKTQATWQEFRDRYEDEVLSGPGSQDGEGSQGLVDVVHEIGARMRRIAIATSSWPCLPSHGNPHRFWPVIFTRRDASIGERYCQLAGFRRKLATSKNADWSIKQGGREWMQAQ
jgi:hypothetical protein